MRYLSEDEINEIGHVVELKTFENVNNPLCFAFDSEIDEYNNFLKVADDFDEWNISKTHLLIHKETKELIGYMTLSTDSIKLTNEEKEIHELNKVPFASIPALKIGKLAINKKLSNNAKRKGYGSFLIEMAVAYAFSINEQGVACRFVTVDADIEYDEDTPKFYDKNGFVENLSNKSRNAKHTISMRKDIFTD